MDLTANELAELIHSRQITPLDAVKASLSRIKHRNGQLNAVIYVNEAQALKEATSWTERQQHGEVLPIWFVASGISCLDWI